MKALWLFRKPRDLGNFSIEYSFREMERAWPNPSPPQWHEVKQLSNGLWNRIKIIREAQGLKADIIHITGDIYFCAFAFRRLRRHKGGIKKKKPQIVATIHDIGYIHHTSPFKRKLIKYFWFNGPLKRIDHLVVVSQATKKAVVHEAPWFPEDKITVIPTVVPQHFNPRKKRPHNPKPVALHIGLAENKNLRRHAEALEGMDVHLKIIGEPSPEDVAMLERHNIDFSWQSKLTDEEMQEAYATSDFLLFASTLEGFGMPIIEAQMVGLPVITSDVDPMREVAGDAALLCNPFNHEDMNRVILELLDDQQSQETLVQRGFENARKFLPLHAAEMHRELYRNLLQIDLL